MSNIILTLNPFQPHLKERHVLQPHETLQHFIESMSLEKLPLLCLHKERFLLKKDRQKFFDPHDDIFIFALPLGGSSSDKTIRSALMLASMAFIPSMGVAIAGSMGLANASLVNLGLAMVSAKIIKTIMPAKKNSLAPFNNANFSPIYTIRAQENYQRLGQAIPSIYGRHLIFPDLIQKPYFTFHNIEPYSTMQAVYYLFAIGSGYYSVENVFFGDIPITTNIQNITYQWINPGEQCTLFDPNFATAHEYSMYDFKRNETIEFTFSNGSLEITSLELDLLFPAGIYMYEYVHRAYEANTISFQIDATPVGSNKPTFSKLQKIQTKTFQSISYSFSYPLPQNSYIFRITMYQASYSKEENPVIIGSIRGKKVQNQPIYDNITLLALKVETTFEITRLANKHVSCIVTRKLPAWIPNNTSPAGGAWSEPIATSSIAWALADICKQYYTDDAINLQELTRLDTIWEKSGDTFNAVFDQTITLWDAINRVALCGSAAVFIQAGKIHFTKDEPRDAPRMLFGSHNIVKNSLKIHYSINPGYDESQTIVEYFSASHWKPDECYAGVKNTHNIDRISLFGCTSTTQAQKLAHFLHAIKTYRRKYIVFSTELEGLIPSYGDSVSISHPLLCTATSSFITEIHENMIVLADPLFIEDSEDYVFAYRDSTGYIHGPYSAVRGSTNYIIHHQISFSPLPQIHNIVILGHKKNWHIEAKITRIIPRKETVLIEAIVDDPRIYESQEDQVL